MIAIVVRNNAFPVSARKGQREGILFLREAPVNLPEWRGQRGRRADVGHDALVAARLAGPADLAAVVDQKDVEGI